MGIVKYFRRLYNNYGTSVTVYFYVGTQGARGENANPNVYFTLPGTDLHRRANAARRKLAANVKASVLRPRLPRDYWLLATYELERVVRAAPLHDGGMRVSEADESLICLLADIAFDTYKNEDTLFVFFAPTQGTRVELMRMHSPDFQTHTFPIAR